MATYGIVPTGVFSLTYVVLAGGEPVARLEHRALSLRDEAAIMVRGVPFAARRERALRSAAVLEAADGQVRAKAERESAWREDHRVTFDGRELRLRRQAFSWRGAFAVEGPGGEIGSIRLERFFSRRLVAEFGAGEPPLEIVAFLAWIALMVHRREAGD